MHPRMISYPTTRWRVSDWHSARSLLLVLAVFTLLTGLLRLVPHPPNFTPVAALALMAGVYVRSLKCALALPILVMGATDMAIGLHPTLPFVYASFALTVLLGRSIRACPNLISVSVAALAASLLFFAVTNLGHWLMMGFYPRTVAGLISSYGAAWGLFGYTLAGDLFFSVCFFGVLAGLRPRR